MLRATEHPASALAGPDSEDPALRAARSFAEVLMRSGAGEGLGAILRETAEEFCELVGTGRCSIYLRDGSDSRFKGRLATPAALDGDVSRSVITTESDALCAESVRTRYAVAVTDVRRDPRTIGSTLRDRGICSLLVVPLVHRDRVLGLALLDDGGRRRRFSPDDVVAAVALGNLVARWMNQSMQGVQLASVRQALTQERAHTERAAALEPRFADVTGQPFEIVLDLVASLARRTVEAVGADGRIIARAHPDDGRADHEAVPGGSDVVLRALEGTAAGHTRLIGVDRGQGLTRRRVATPLDLPEGRGYLALIEDGTPLGTFDTLLAPRAAVALGHAGQPERNVGLPRAAARSMLVAQLLGQRVGTATTEVLARRLGMDRRRPRVVVEIAPAPDAHDAWADDLFGASMHVPVRTESGTAFIVDLRAGVPARQETSRLRDAVVELLVREGADPTTAVGVSAVCRELVDLPRALRQAHQLVVTARDDGVSGPVGRTADELGPMRLLFTTPEDASKLGEDVLGPLLGGDPSHRDLLATLTTLFEQQGSISATAAALDIHVNTVRHRFARIRTATDLDVIGNMNDRMLALAAVSALRYAGPPERPGSASPDVD